MGKARSRDCEVGEDNQFCDDTSQCVLQRAKDQPKDLYFHQSISYSPEKLTCPKKNSGWKTTILLKWSLLGNMLVLGWCI